MATLGGEKALGTHKRAIRIFSFDLFAVATRESGSEMAALDLRFYRFHRNKYPVACLATAGRYPSESEDLPPRLDHYASR
jgi:hypothetical protein